MYCGTNYCEISKLHDRIQEDLGNQVSVCAVNSAAHAEKILLIGYIITVHKLIAKQNGRIKVVYLQDVRSNTLFRVILFNACAQKLEDSGAKEMDLLALLHPRLSPHTSIKHSSPKVYDKQILFGRRSNESFWLYQQPAEIDFVKWHLIKDKHKFLDGEDLLEHLPPRVGKQFSNDVGRDVGGGRKSCSPWQRQGSLGASGRNSPSRNTESSASQNINMTSASKVMDDHEISIRLTDCTQTNVNKHHLLSGKRREQSASGASVSSSKSPSKGGSVSSNDSKISSGLNKGMLSVADSINTGMNVNRNLETSPSKQGPRFLDSSNTSKDSISRETVELEICKGNKDSSPRLTSFDDVGLSNCDHGKEAEPARNSSCKMTRLPEKEPNFLVQPGVQREPFSTKVVDEESDEAQHPTGKSSPAVEVKKYDSITMKQSGGYLLRVRSAQSLERIEPNKSKAREMSDHRDSRPIIGLPLHVELRSQRRKTMATHEGKETRKPENESEESLHLVTEGTPCTESTAQNNSKELYKIKKLKEIEGGEIVHTFVVVKKVLKDAFKASISTVSLTVHVTDETIYPQKLEVVIITHPKLLPQLERHDIIRFNHLHMTSSRGKLLGKIFSGANVVSFDVSQITPKKSKVNRISRKTHPTPSDEDTKRILQLAGWVKRTKKLLSDVFSESPSDDELWDQLSDLEGDTCVMKANSSLGRTSEETALYSSCSPSKKADDCEVGSKLKIVNTEMNEPFMNHASESLRCDSEVKMCETTRPSELELSPKVVIEQLVIKIPANPKSELQYGQVKESNDLKSSQSSSPPKASLSDFGLCTQISQLRDSQLKSYVQSLSPKEIVSSS